ncbi:hypothetical protein GQX73_g7968 [Xylaria multiplex]|uniref:Thioesterase domain-containing protein n=1 Tax=Xylaria multiplex TaxID=323545 RepID=A0A7C8MLV0_9PEZI|nr:hypothetical protein GQX73_g7968 [Xylaria multiplex]
MVTTSVSSVLAWEADCDSDLQYFRSLSWSAPIISKPEVRPYKAESPFRTRRGMIPVVNSFMFHKGGLLRHVSLVAPANVTTFASTLSDVSAPHLPELPTASKRRIRTLGSLSPRGAEEYPIHLDFLTLGPALHGPPRTVHGGVLSLLADGICAKTAWMHKDPLKQIYTARIQIQFLKPAILDDGDTISILAKSRIVQHLTGLGKIVVIAQFEGSQGDVYATAESLLLERSWRATL